MEAEKIFDSFNKISDLIHIRDRFKKLKDQNFQIKNTCGGCRHWMKKSDCPKEAKGIMVSCDMYICPKFAISDLSQQTVTRNILEMKSLEP